jgi:hypothetical protein
MWVMKKPQGIQSCCLISTFSLLLNWFKFWNIPDWQLIYPYQPDSLTSHTHLYIHTHTHTQTEITCLKYQSITTIQNVQDQHKSNIAITENCVIHEEHF